MLLPAPTSFLANGAVDVLVHIHPDTPTGENKDNALPSISQSSCIRQNELGICVHLRLD